LKTKSASVEIKESAWIKLNVDQTGFYRVKYDENLGGKIRHAIESNQLSPTDRFGEINLFCCLALLSPLIEISGLTFLLFCGQGSWMTHMHSV